MRLCGHGDGGPAGAQRLKVGVGTHLGQLGAEQFPRAIWTDGWIDGAHGSCQLPMASFQAGILWQLATGEW